MTAEVSVVIPTRERPERLDAMLRSLDHQSLAPDRVEVIVVDDGSTGDAADALTRIADELSYRLTLLGGAGRGPAAARNRGWQAAEGQLVAFTDDDCEADPDWLHFGLAAYERTGQVVQGRTRPIPREASIRGITARSKWIDGPGPWYQTCNIFYPRGILERLGGFDEGFRRPFGEDADLAWRTIEAGSQPVFEPRALVHHAVDRLSIFDYLRDGVRDPDEALIFRRHPALTKAVARLGLFKSDHHALLTLAVGAFVVRPRSLVARSLGAAYLTHAAVRARAAGSGAWAVPALAAHDALELASAVRGALRHRAPLI